jgi:hypothetical protein
LTYELDEELAAEMLTDEAIKTFEDDEQDAKQVWSSHQHQSQEDADADQVWNYWSCPYDDEHDYAAQAMA